MKRPTNQCSPLAVFLYLFPLNHFHWGDFFGPNSSPPELNVHKTIINTDCLIFKKANKT